MKTQALAQIPETKRADGPVALSLSRQKVPTLDRADLAPASGLERGAYTLWESGPSPDLIEQPRVEYLEKERRDHLTQYHVRLEIAPGRTTDEPRHMSSPAFRIAIGTIGTPACIAMWNAPFLNRARRGVGVRVPSGAIVSDTPFRSFSTTGSSADRASAELLRSM